MKKIIWASIGVLLLGFSCKSRKIRSDSKSKSYDDSQIHDNLLSLISERKLDKITFNGSDSDNKKCSVKIEISKNNLTPLCKRKDAKCVLFESGQYYIYTGAVNISLLAEPTSENPKLVFHAQGYDWTTEVIFLFNDAEELISIEFDPFDPPRTGKILKKLTCTSRDL